MTHGVFMLYGNNTAQPCYSCIHLHNQMHVLYIVREEERDLSLSLSTYIYIYIITLNSFRLCKMLG